MGRAKGEGQGSAPMILEHISLIVNKLFYGRECTMEGGPGDESHDFWNKVSVMSFYGGRHGGRAKGLLP